MLTQTTNELGHSIYRRNQNYNPSNILLLILIILKDLNFQKYFRSDINIDFIPQSDRLYKFKYYDKLLLASAYFLSF